MELLPERACARGNLKAMDLVAMRRQKAPGVVWLIEAKDFRVIRGQPNDRNISGLADDVWQRVKDTLTGLAEAAVQGEGIEREHARRAMAGKTRRIVVHVEPHTGRHSALLPKNFAAGVLQKLRQLVREIDPKPLVLDMVLTRTFGVPWSVG